MRGSQRTPQSPSPTSTRPIPAPRASHTAKNNLNGQPRDATGQDARTESAIRRWVDAGTCRVTPVIYRHCPFHETPAVVAYQVQGHPAGKVVITV
jgi:hypothetical protein